MPDTKDNRSIEAVPFFGARCLAASATEFSVWAPAANRVVVDIIDGPQGVAMEKQPGGFHRVVIDGVAAGARYVYRVDGGPGRPDPASRFQPDGVHGPSQVVDPAFVWNDADWQGPERDELIIYELHVGAFTELGTYLSAIDRLDELVDLGITAVELMPVAASAGRWNWGYDGVAFFAPDSSYGTPEELRRFVDAAHARGLAVFLDVVYNHAGPEGNYLHDFGPYFSSRHRTVWGDAPNFDDPRHGDAVRQFFIANAVYWLDEFRLDGLRVDAIHCMADDREPHIAAEISDAVDDWSRRSGRHVMLIAESNLYDPEMVLPRSAGGIGFDAMWCDDFLHSMFAMLRPQEQLTVRKYHQFDDLDQTLRLGYVFEGTLRRPQQRVVPERRAESRVMVYSIQNHDFIGNHPLGQRLHQLVGDDAHRAAAALMLLCPAIPMLFMGEEFACENPFCFFVDFSDDHLRQSVVSGRQREYPQHDWDSGVLPTDPTAFHSAKLGPRDAGNPQTLHWYRRLIEVRRRFKRSGLLCDDNLTVETNHDQNLFVLRYRNEQETLTVAARLSDGTADEPALDWPGEGELLLDSRFGEDGANAMLLPNHAIVSRQPN